jgi:hypothetical protein
MVTVRSDPYLALYLCRFGSRTAPFPTCIMITAVFKYIGKVAVSVSDPDPALLAEYRSGLRFLMIKNWKKFTTEK